MLLLFLEMMQGKELCCCCFVCIQYLAQNLWDPGQNLNMGSLTQIFLRIQDDISKTLKQALDPPDREARLQAAHTRSCLRWDIQAFGKYVLTERLREQGFEMNIFYSEH